MKTCDRAPRVLSAAPSQFALAHAIVDLLPADAIKTVRQLNALFKGAQIIASALAQPPVMAFPGMGLARWLDSDDTGSSSLFMAATLYPDAVPDSGALRKRSDFPHDAGDFGRCARFLEAVPESAKRLAEVAECGGPVWRRLVADWSELTTLLKRSDGRELTERIRRIIAEAS